MFSPLENVVATRSAKRVALRVAIFVACIVFFSACRSTAQEANAGWVLDVKGQWAVSGGTTLLAQAASVPAGGLLVNLAPKDGDYIRIADLHGELLKSLRCSQSGCGQCTKNQDNCTAPIDALPKGPEQPGLMAATWEGLMDLFGGQPERYSVHRSRSIGADNCIAESVVPVDALGKTHLDGLLTRCEAGAYTLEFVSASADRAGKGAREVTVSWGQNQAASVDLAEGLYRVKYTRGFQTGYAWVLVSPAATAEQDRAAFERVSAVVDGWGLQVESDSKVAYKRAYLDYLSRRKGGSDQAR